MRGPPPPLSSSRAERGICFSWLCFHHLHENVFQVLHRVAGAELRQRPLGQELAVVDDADGGAELFGFAHHLGGGDGQHSRKSTSRKGSPRRRLSAPPFRPFSRPKYSTVSRAVSRP